MVSRYSSRLARATSVVALVVAAAVLTSCDPGGAVGSRVVDGLGMPLAGVTVEAQDPITGEIVGETTTAGDGSYVIGVKPGTWALRFDKTGFAPEWYEEQTSLAAANTVVVADGDALTINEVALEPTASIGGTVTNGFAPVPALGVRIEDSGAPGTAVAVTTTDAEGAFVVHGLTAGSYLVRLDDPTYVPGTSGYRPEYAESRSSTNPGDGDVHVLAAGDQVDVGNTIVAGSDCDPATFVPGANLAAANLAGADLRGCDLTGDTLTAANLTGADLTGAAVSGSALAGANVTGATIRGADFSAATGFPTVIGLLSTVANRWSATRFDGSDLDLAATLSAGADLAEANLSGLDLSGAGLSQIALTGAKLEAADLTGADVSEADLTGGALGNADLTGADLTSAYVSGADFTDADLFTANLHAVKDAKATYTGATMTAVRRTDVDRLEAEAWQPKS